jgi:hypothetical protein
MGLDKSRDVQHRRLDQYSLICIAARTCGSKRVRKVTGNEQNGEVKKRCPLLKEDLEFD